MASSLIRLLSLPGALLLSCAAAAQALSDPTLPPASLRSAGTDAVASPAPKLQMILRGPDDVHRALIDGQWLRVGDLLPGATARVMRVTDSAVVLARGTDNETLELLPTIAKRPARPSDAARDPPP